MKRKKIQQRYGIYLSVLNGKKQRAKALQPFEEMGRRFAKTHCFDKEEVSQFAEPEFFSKVTLRAFQCIGRHIQRMFMSKMAKSLGCKQKLDVRPYDNVQYNK